MATTTVSAAASFPSLSCFSHRRQALLYSSPFADLDPKNPKFHFCASFPQLGLSSSSSWRGLKHLGISFRQNYGQKKKKGKCRGRIVYASLFGVGAPEALVIGVVALLVFGPKGLAEVARNLGKTLRAFQPTIRELQEVSRDFKSTLEREIGLDEVASTADNTYKSTSVVNENQQALVDPNGIPTAKPNTSEELLKITQEQMAASAIRPQAPASSPEEQMQVSSTISEALSAKPDVTSTTSEAVVTKTDFTSPASPRGAAKTPSPEKADNER